MTRRLIALLAVTGVLAACAPAPKRPSAAAISAYEARTQVLAGLDQWEITGRLAITDGEQGGSGALTWLQDGDRTRMSFRGTFGQGSWMLEADSAGARLQLGDGSEFAARDVATLVQAQVGWNVPVEALTWWVRGMAADGAWDERRLDTAGRLVELQQSGWAVEFGNYREHEPVWLPSRLFASRGDYAVKLIVRDWDFEGEVVTP